MSNSFPTQLFEAEKQQLMDRLLEENRNGIISPADLQVLQGLVEEAEKLMMENAKNLAATADPQPPTIGATPVTIWSKPTAASK